MPCRGGEGPHALLNVHVWVHACPIATEAAHVCHVEEGMVHMCGCMRVHGIYIV